MNDVIMTMSEVKKDPKYNVTFGKYLDINPDLYMDIALSKEIVPARIVTALYREHCDTLYSLLNYKLNEFINIPNMGLVALNEVITAIQAYCSKHKGISYSENPLFPKIYDILSEEYSDFIAYCKHLGKTSPYNLLTYDYEVFREKNQLSHRYISTLRKTVAEFCTINSSMCNFMCSVDSLMSLYRHSDYCLAQIFGVFPEMYNGVTVEDVGYNSLCTHSLTRNFQRIGYCRTLSDVLYCTIDDLHKFYALGKLSVLRIITETREYIKRNSGTLIKRKHRSYCDTSIKLQELNYTLMEVAAKRSHKGQLQLNMDSKLIDRFMNASLLLDTELYSATLEQSSEMLDIMTALNDFANPIL